MEPEEIIAANLIGSSEEIVKRIVEQHAAGQGLDMTHHEAITRQKNKKKKKPGDRYK